MIPELDRAITAVRAAAGCAGDASGNCDAAVHLIERGDFARSSVEMEWAEINAKSALRRIAEARAAIAKATD